MARIYYGNRSRVEENLDVVRALSQLSDEYWALLEFDIPGGNIDCLVVRPARPDTPPDVPSVLILTEVKHVAGRLSGLENGPWRIERNGIESTYSASNSQDDNPWQQTIRMLNQLRAWMATNQPVFLDPGTRHESNDIKIWPMLLVVRTDSDDPHALPLAPMNRFGTFVYSTDAWLQYISSWMPRVGIQLSVDAVKRLVRTLSLTEWEYGPERELPENSSGQDGRSPTAQRPVHLAPPEGDDALDWANGLVAWARQMEERVTALERQARQPSTTGKSNADPVTRSLTDAERSALEAAVRKIASLGQMRAFPNVVRYMSEELGYSLKEQGYNGFRTAGHLLGQAEREGIIRFGPNHGPTPTVYLPNEEAPAES